MYAKKNGRTDRDDVLGVDSCGPKEPGRGRTNPSAAMTGDKVAMRPFNKIL